jgi:galactokinase
LGRAGHRVPPLDLALDSTVPAGAGLSSSAAVECAVALAISDYLSLGLPPGALARMAQRAENDFVGMPCGLMDQMASTASSAGHALLFDVGADSTELIPFDPAASGLVVEVINTRAHHSLANGEYARRRAECERAARELGVTTLSEIDVGQLREVETGLADERLQRRVRHVVTENDRVRQVVALLRAGRVGSLGPHLSASHASLRDDFEVSCRELDLAAATAERAGSLGARMVGGGFGGSVIALTRGSDAHRVAGRVIDEFVGAGLTAPSVTSVTPAAGAHRDR